MLSREYLRERPDEVKARLRDRGVDVSLVDRWSELDTERRALLVESETLKQQRNEASKRIGEKKRAGADAAEEISAVGALKERIETLEAKRKLSQNRSDADIAGTIEGLRAGAPAERAVADAMRTSAERSPG